MGGAAAQAGSPMNTGGAPTVPSGGTTGSGGAEMDAATSDRDSGAPRCAGDAHDATAAPSDLYFLVDTSGSMNELVKSGSKWDALLSAFDAFVKSPAVSSSAVGIGYFPPTACLGNICVEDPNACTADPYAKPGVALVLPPNPSGVVADLALRRPAGNTPTTPALQGTTQYVKTWGDGHTDRRTSIVVATDGEPDGCQQNTAADVANVAASALASKGHVRTFVVGFGNLQALDAVAAAGGTSKAYLVDTNGDVVKSIADALDSVRFRASSCSYVMPKGSAKQPADPGMLNLSYTAPGGTSPTTIPSTPSHTAATCGIAGGWYYDDPSAPKTISVCDTTCDAFAPDGKITVELGCPTVTP